MPRRWRRRPLYEREWELLHKGDLKELNGDKKLYRAWVKKVQAFCNTKRPGLDATQWEHISAANTKLCDMLIQTCTADALMKIETTPGEDQALRRGAGWPASVSLPRASRVLTVST